MELCTVQLSDMDQHHLHPWLRANAWKLVHCFYEDRCICKSDCFGFLCHSFIILSSILMLSFCCRLFQPIFSPATNYSVLTWNLRVTQIVFIIIFMYSFTLTRMYSHMFISHTSQLRYLVRLHCKGQHSMLRVRHLVWLPQATRANLMRCKQNPVCTLEETCIYYQSMQ